MNTVDPRHNRRSYAAREYYEPNASRPNLFLLTYALVSKIQLDKLDDGVRATGVCFMVDGVSRTIKVNKEVIVCGGTINSPQILELSGIGAPAVLHGVGIETAVDNVAVGENLNDHTATALTLVKGCYDNTLRNC
jgi:choline dehydrogenase